MKYSPTIAAAALLFLLAAGCGDGGRAGPHPFEAVLAGGDLARFEGLPPEFQEALREESEETSIATALRHMGELPDEVTPIAEILPPEALGRFEELSPRYRRAVLLGYDEAFKERPGQDPAELPPPSAILAGMVDTVHQIEFGDHKVFLPPMADTLSQEALDKLDSVDPMMKRAFELVWDNREVLPEEVDGLARRLGEALLAAPDTLPDIADVGLSAHSLEALDEVPAARRLVVEWLAAEVVQDVGWRSKIAASIDEFLGQFRTPEDRANLARLYPPARSGTSPVVCYSSHPSFGVWPTWALPEVFRDVPPNHLIARWPSHRDALSPAALARLDSLDARLQDGFGEYWYGTGPLPMEARRMACLTLRWSYKLEHIAFTAVPPLESILSDEALAEYDTLAERDRYLIEMELVRGILEGELFPGPSTPVYLHTMSTEEALKAVGGWAEAEIRAISERRAN